MSLQQQKALSRRLTRRRRNTSRRSSGFYSGLPLLPSTYFDRSEMESVYLVNPVNNAAVGYYRAQIARWPTRSRVRESLLHEWLVSQLHALISFATRCADSIAPCIHPF